MLLRDYCPLSGFLKSIRQFDAGNAIAVRGAVRFVDAANYPRPNSKSGDSLT